MTRSKCFDSVNIVFSVYYPFTVSEICPASFTGFTMEELRNTLQKQRNTRSVDWLELFVLESLFSPIGSVGTYIYNLGSFPSRWFMKMGMWKS